MNNLEAISPIDGRYRGKTEPLAEYFSESALIRYRVRVEIEYYIALVKELGSADVTPALAESLRDTKSSYMVRFRSLKRLSFDATMKFT